MKRFILGLLLLPSLVFGQTYKGLFNTSGSFFQHDTTVHVPSFVFTSSPTQRVARHGVPVVGHVDLPYGYNPATVSYKVVAHNPAKTVVYSHSGTTYFNHTFNFQSMDSVNVYALEVYIKEGPIVASSTTSKNLTGLTLPQTFTVQTGMNISAGHVFRVAARSDTSNYIQAAVTSYNSGTGALVLAAAGGTIHGSGTYAQWDVFLPRIWPWREPGCFPVLKAKFTEGEADLVYDESTTLPSGDGRDHPGVHKVYVKGHGTNPLFFFYFNGTATNPIHFIFDDVQVSSSARKLNTGPNRYCIFDGVASEDPTKQYGLTLTTTGTSTAEVAYNKLADNLQSSDGLYFAGIHCDNVSATNGGTGFRLESPKNASFNASTDTVKRIMMFNILIEHPKNEGLYDFYTRDFNDPTYTASKGQWVWVFRITTYDTGNEGIQIGSAFDIEVFRNVMINSGVSGTPGQDYNTEWSLGNRRMAWYCNFSTTPHAGMQGFTGQSGGDCSYFSNIIICTTIASSNIYKAYHNDTYTDVRWWFKHNTLVSPSGVTFNLYNDISLGSVNISLHFIATENCLVSNTTTQSSNNGGFSSSNCTFSNKAYSSSSTPLFRDLSSGDVRPRSLASPLFSTTENTTDPLTHPWAGMDYYGMPFYAENLASGAAAGTELMTHLH